MLAAILAHGAPSPLPLPAARPPGRPAARPPGRPAAPDRPRTVQHRPRMTRPYLSPRNLLEDVRASFWALPLLGMLVAAALAVGTHALDAALFDGAPRTDGFVATVRTDTVRSVLATLATAMAGVTGIAFSVTVTTLTLASQQFGPHVLRIYMQRRFVQGTLATLVGTVLYAVLALHLLGAADRLGYAPAATAAAALALAFVDLALLVLFVHVTATSIQVDSIIASVHADHLSRLATLFPGRGRRGEPDAVDGRDVGDSLAAGTGLKVRAPRDGYLQSVDRAGLVALARRRDVRVAVAQEPGAWVVAGSVLATVHAPTGATMPGAGRADAHADAHAANAADDDEARELERDVRRLLVLGRSPTPEQDPRFALRQLQQIAQRALSPALNDPQTAASCIARVGSICSDLLGRDAARHRFVDAGGTVRLVERRSDPGELVRFAFDPLTRAGAGRADTSADLLDTIRRLVELHPDSAWLDALDEQLERIETGLARETPDRFDAARLDALLAKTRSRLRAARPGPADDAAVAANDEAAGDAANASDPGDASRPAARSAQRVSSSRGSAGTGSSP